MEERPRRSVMLFALRFLALVAPFTAAWWLLVPLYGRLLVQIAGGILKFGLGTPIEYGFIQSEGILNTNSLLVFGMNGVEKSLPIALLVTNVAPYLALVFATLDLSWKRRGLIIGYGVGILLAGHAAFLVYAMRFNIVAEEAGMAANRLAELPAAIVQLFLTLPFLLWIVFAYWEKLGALLAETDS